MKVFIEVNILEYSSLKRHVFYNFQPFQFIIKLSKVPTRITRMGGKGDMGSQNYNKVKLSFFDNFTLLVRLKWLSRYKKKVNIIPTHKVNEQHITVSIITN